VKTLKVSDEIHTRLLIMSAMQRKKIGELACELLEQPTSPYANITIKTPGNRKKPNRVR